MLQRVLRDVAKGYDLEQVIELLQGRELQRNRQVQLVFLFEPFFTHMGSLSDFAGSDDADTKDARSDV